MNMEQLLDVLSKKIEKKDDNITLNHLTHYILAIMGNLQGYSIVWWQEEKEEFIDCPRISFDQNGLCSELTTHEQTDLSKTFLFVYDVFQNQFMKKGVVTKRKAIEFGNKKTP